MKTGPGAGCPSGRGRGGGFSLVEMLVALAILAMILAFIFGITQQVGTVWKNSSGKIESFQGARAAFESMTRSLGQATLNNFYDYDDPNAPTAYVRKSALHFVCGKSLVPGQVAHAVFFQAPLGYTQAAAAQGLGTLLNACGYYVRYGDDLSRPSFLAPATPRYRFRLMQYLQPAENLGVYVYAPLGGANAYKWFTADLAATPPANLYPLAENIVALVVLPALSILDRTASGSAAPLAPAYEYDTLDASKAGAASANQLPPLLQVAMVAIDEPSALRLGNGAAAPNFLQGPSGVLFTDSTRLGQDLQALGNNLDAAPGNAAGNRVRLNYRVFQSEVALRNAKWSN